MKQSKVISIIIPVYNTEGYLDDCVRSIVGQRYGDFELILVNDGSRDGSLEICRKWEAQDERIRVIDKENGGVSSARNAGIEQAMGEWVTFIDSDDWVKPDYLESLVQNVNKHSGSVDWVTSGITYYYADGRRQAEAPENTGFFTSDTPDGLLAMAAQKLVTSPVGKLYRLSIIADNNLTFDPELSYGEDRDFNLRYLGYCESCLITDYNGYCYRKDISTSLSTKKPGNLLKGDLDYWTNLYNLFNTRSFMASDIRSYLINRLYNFVLDYMSAYSLTGEQVRIVQGIVDCKFVERNRFLIQGNRIYRWLFANRQIGLLNRLISLCTRR